MNNPMTNTYNKRQRYLLTHCVSHHSGPFSNLMTGNASETKVPQYILNKSRYRTNAEFFMANETNMRVLLTLRDIPRKPTRTDWFPWLFIKYPNYIPTRNPSTCFMNMPVKYFYDTHKQSLWVMFDQLPEFVVQKIIFFLGTYIFPHLLANKKLVAFTKENIPTMLLSWQVGVRQVEDVNGAVNLAIELNLANMGNNGLLWTIAKSNYVFTQRSHSLRVGLPYSEWGGDVKTYIYFTPDRSWAVPGMHRGIRYKLNEGVFYPDGFAETPEEYALRVHPVRLEIMRIARETDNEELIRAWEKWQVYLKAKANGSVADYVEARHAVAEKNGIFLSKIREDKLYDADPELPTLLDLLFGGSEPKSAFIVQYSKKVTFGGFKAIDGSDRILRSRYAHQGRGILLRESTHACAKPDNIPDNPRIANPLEDIDITGCWSLGQLMVVLVGVLIFSVYKRLTHK